MVIKKSKKNVYGAILSSAEKKAMEMEIRRELAEYDRRHTAEMDALILWVLHEKFGFGIQRLRRFYNCFTKEIENLLDRYELKDDDQVWLCTHKLKEYGIDLEKWHEETGRNSSKTK